MHDLRLRQWCKGDLYSETVGAPSRKNIQILA